jgi:general secretion pathway protein F
VSISASLVAQPITLDQLAALSDEIAALARAGVPLDRGLRELARDMPGRLGRLADELGTRLQSGQPLDRAVADRLSSSLPPAYRAVIAAGLRAGRLPAALEGVSRTARLIGQLRRTVGLSLIYPLVVLSLTWLLGLFVLIKIAPLTVHMLKEFKVTSAPLDAALAEIIRTASWWGPLIPLLAGAWLAFVWYRSGRVAAGVELHPSFAFGAVGTLARMQCASRYASLSELLALLLHSGVSIPEAVELASAAVGSPKLAAGGKDLAHRLSRGETIRQSPPGFPPLLAWMIAGGHSQPKLCQSLLRTAEVYREEVVRRSQWLTLYVPLILTIAICGGIVFIYAILTLGPWIAIMRRVAEPQSLFF